MGPPARRRSLAPPGEPRARGTRRPAPLPSPRRPDLREVLTTWLAGAARSPPPRRPPRARRAYAARRKGRAPAGRGWASGGGPGGLRAVADASPGPLGRADGGAPASAAKTASAPGHAGPSPVLRAHMRLRGGRARRAPPGLPAVTSRRGAGGARARVPASLPSRPHRRCVRPAPRTPPPRGSEWAHPHPGIAAEGRACVRACARVTWGGGWAPATAARPARALFPVRGFRALSLDLGRETAVVPQRRASPAPFSRGRCLHFILLVTVLSAGRAWASPVSRSGGKSGLRGGLARLCAWWWPARVISSEDKAFPL